MPFPSHPGSSARVLPTRGIRRGRRVRHYIYGGILCDPGASSTLSADRGEPLHDRCSQGASALLRGVVGGPPIRIRVRGPRAEPRRPPLPRLIGRAPPALRPPPAPPAPPP